MKLHRYNTYSINESADSVNEKKLMPSEFLHPLVNVVKKTLSKSKDNNKWAEETAAALNKIRIKSAAVAPGDGGKVVYYIHPDQISLAMVIHPDKIDFYKRLKITKQVDKDVTYSVKTDDGKKLEPIDTIAFDDKVSENLISFSKAKEWIKDFIEFLGTPWKSEEEKEIVNMLAKDKKQFMNAPIAAFDYLQKWNDANKDILSKILGNTSDEFSDKYANLLAGKVTESNMKNIKTFDELNESNRVDIRSLILSYLLDADPLKPSTLEDIKQALPSVDFDAEDVMDILIADGLVDFDGKTYIPTPNGHKYVKNKK